MPPRTNLVAQVCHRSLPSNFRFATCIDSLQHQPLSANQLHQARGVCSSRSSVTQQHRRQNALMPQQRMQCNLIKPVHDPYMKAWDVRYVRFAAPDLDLMQRFCLDFGMFTVSRSDSTLYMRGHGDDAAVHITHKAKEASFLGFGIDADSEADLHRFAKAEGCPVEANTEPGGGAVVRLRSPEGYQLEVLAGGQKAAPSQGTSPSVPSNYANDRDGNYSGHQRVGYVKRVSQESGPKGEFTPFHPNDAQAHQPAANPVRSSHVMRLGHVVIGCGDFEESERWWKQRFGLITSDEIHHVGDEGKVVGAFMRFDRGEAYTDHHSIFLINNDGSGPLGNGQGRQFFHAAFEVANMDDLFVGNTHLKEQREKGAHYHHARGIGRHINGSQIYDYWHDPFGNQMEHWTDGDQLRLADGSNRADVDQLLASQWGPTNVLREPWPGPKETLAEPVG